MDNQNQLHSDQETKTLCMPEPQIAPAQPARSPPVRVWPVPHIMVSYHDRSIAWGRFGLALEGYKSSRRAFCRALIYDPARHGSHRRWFAWRNARKVHVIALFCKTNARGTGTDESWVELGSVGWVGLVDNVVEMRLTYDEN